MAGTDLNPVLTNVLPTVSPQIVPKQLPLLKGGDAVNLSGNGDPHSDIIPLPAPNTDESGYTKIVSAKELFDNRQYDVFDPDKSENFYAYGQSGWDKAINGVAKFTGTAATTIAGGTIGLLYGLGSVATTGKLTSFYDNPFFQEMDKIDEEMRIKFPHMYTDAERRDPFSANAIFSGNFLWDKIVSNLGYAAGAAATGYGAGLALEALNLSKGLVLAGRGIQALEATEAAVAESRGMASMITKLRNAVGSGVESLGTISSGSPFSPATRAGAALFSSTGESGMEAYQAKKQFIQKAIEEYKLQNLGQEPPAEYMNEVYASAERVGNFTMGMNLALLTATQYIQLPKIFSSTFSGEKRAMNGVLFRNGLWESTLPTSKIGKVLYGAKKGASLLFNTTEAFEEGAQFAIEQGTNSYFNQKGKGKEDWINALGGLLKPGGEGIMGTGVVNTLTTDEGLENILLGGLSGALMTSGIVGLHNGRPAIGKTGKIGERGVFGFGGQEAEARTEQLKWNDVPFVKKLAEWKNFVEISEASQQKRQEFIRRGDIFESKDAEADYMLGYLMPRVKYASSDAVQQEVSHVRQQAMSDEGWAALKENGTAHPEDTKESFLARLGNIERMSMIVQNSYNQLSTSLSGQYQTDKDGKPVLDSNKQPIRKYSDTVINKLVYSIAKVSDYTNRIPQLEDRLSKNNISLSDIFELVDKKASVEKINEAFNTQADAIVELKGLSDIQKAELLGSLTDATKMQMRKNGFINEQNDILKNPEKYDTQPSATVVEEEKGEEKEETPEAPKPTPMEKPIVNIGEEGAPSPMAEVPEPSYFVNSKNEDEPLEIGREYINNDLYASDPLHKFKVLGFNDNGSVNIELADGSTTTVDTEELDGSEKIRNSKDVIVDNAKEIKEIQDELEEEDSDINTGFEVDEYNDEKEGAIPSADKLFFRTKTASSRNYPNGLPINITRYNEFVNNVDGFANRKNIRFVYVTPNQQDALGLSKLAELSYMKGDDFVTTPEWLDSISAVDTGLVMAVFVEFDNGKLFLIDKDGKRIKNQDGSDAVLGNANNNFDIKQTIFSTTPTVNEKARSSDDPNVVKQYKTLWEDQRKALFSTQYQPGSPIDSYEFGLSKGHAVKEEGVVQHNAISKVFNKIKQSVISGVQGLIEISTLGYITHKDGIAYKFAVGRPVLKYGDKLEYLQNDKVTPNQAITIVEVLKKLHNVLVDSSMSTDQKKKENVKLFNYIKAVLFWSSKRITNNSFFINYATGDINIAGQNFDFSNIEGQEKEIIAALSNVYTNTSNELLTKYFNEPFYEQFWDGKQLQERKWTNYQTYLLSDVMPDNKTKRTTAPPLTINVTVPTESVPYAYEQKYAFPTNFKLAVPQAPVTETPVAPVPEPTGFKTDGTPNKIMFNGVQFTFTHNGTEATVDLSPEFLNGEELIEGVKKIAQANPNVDPELIRSTFISAAIANINNVMNEQIAAQAPTETKKRSTPEEIDAAFAGLTKESADLEIRRNALPETQSNTRSAATMQILDYFAEVEGIDKFDEPLDKGTYVKWLQEASPLGYAVAEKLNAPRAAFDLITEDANRKKSITQPAVAPVKTSPKGKVTKFSILGEEKRFDPRNANPDEKSVYYGVDEEGDVFMLAPESRLSKMIDDSGVYISRLYDTTIPKGMRTRFVGDVEERRGVIISELPKVDSQGNLIKKGKLTYTDRPTIKYGVEPEVSVTPEVKPGKLYDLDEELNNYELAGEFKFITPLLQANNIQVSYDAAHLGGKLPKVASIDTEVVDGKYKIILTINKSTFDTKSATEQEYIIAHEFVHGLIKVKLNEKGDIKGTELYKGLTDIYQSVQDYFHKAASGIDKQAAEVLTKNFSKPQISHIRNMLAYIAASPEEMATIGLTDPDVSKFLKLMPGTAPAYTKKSLFAQLADMVSKFLGLNNSKFNDLLTFMSEKLEQASAAPNAGLGLGNTAANYTGQPIEKKSRRRNQYPVYETLSAEQKYYLTEDFKAKFYITLFRDNRSLYNIDTNSANAIFKGIVDNYKENGHQFTDEQYTEIIDATKRQLASLYISFNSDELATINDESASDRLYAPEAFSVNLKKSTPFAVKILTSSLVRTDGKQSEDPRYLPNVKLNEKHGTIELIPESEVYSALVNKLVNIKNAQDFVDKLYKIAQSNADYVQLFVKLGGNMVTGQVDFDAMDDADFRLFVSAMQTFTKAKPEMFIQYLKEDSTFRGAADLTNGAKQVEKRWINNMITSSKIESSVIKYNKQEKQFEANVGDPDISTPEKMIDFLNKLGITFTMPIYNKLSETQVNKFTKAVIKIKADLTSGKNKGVVTLKKGKFRTLGNGITRLADLFTAVEMPNQNNSLYNAEGKRINSLTESNAPSLFEYQFNSIMNVSEIAEKMPQLLDIFSKSSQILQEGGPIFNEDGDRRLDEFGNPIELKVQVISGEIDQDNNEGGGVSGMSQSDRFITQINQNINGSYYILVPADSATEWMMNLGNRISYNQFASGRGYEDAFEIMLSHLNADIELALDAKNRELLKNVGKKGRDLRFFKEILSENLLTKLDSLIEQRITGKIKEKKFRNELADLKSENFEVIKKDILNYLTESRDNLINALEDLKLVTVFSDKNGEALYRFAKLDSNFQDELMTKYGVNTNSMSKEDLDTVAEFLSTNYILNNIELHKILFGDPYQFAIKNKNGKTILEETKRVKIFLSPRKFSVDFPELNAWLNESDNTIYTDTEDIALDENDFGYHENKSYINTAVVKDVIVEADLYPGMGTNEADAFSYMSPGFYREVKTKNAQWSDAANDFHNWQMAYARKQLAAKGIYKGYENKPALKKYDEELTSKPSPVFVTDVIKPVVSGDKFGKTSIDLVGHKMSQMPLYYQAVEGKALEDLFIKMFNEKRDYIVMESGGKIGTLEKRHELYKDGKINDEPFNNLVQVPFKAYGIQVETGYKDKKGTTLGSQATKIATVDLYSGGEAISDDPERQQIIKEAVERHDNALKALYAEAADSLLNDLGITLEDGQFVLDNKRKLANVLTQEVLTEDASDNLIASLEINEETGDFVLPLESSASYMQIVRLLYSIIHKRIVSPKVNGMSAVQVPVTGWEDASKGRRVVEINGKNVLTDDTLKFYEDKDGERYCEIYVTLPSQARVLFSDKNKFPNDEAIVNYLNTQSPEALKGVGFRIPTQGLNSMERFVIKGLLADFMGATVVVPSAITTKVGSDFDIDKLNMYFKALYKDANGDIRPVELKGSEEETKAFYSEIFDQMSEKEQRYISKLMDEADYEDVDLQEKLVGKQEKLNDRIANKEMYINKTYRQALENEYYSAIDTLLGLPENFKRLTTPNTTDTLMGIADEMDKLTGYDESAIKNRILDRTYMSFLRHAFITGKNWIGISATATTGHSNAQKAGTFVDHIFKMSLPHNKTADGKVDLSQRFFAGTKKYISDILSEYTSSFADVGNDPFIFKLIYSDQVVSSFMFLARAGVDTRQAALFLNQPIIKDFVTKADAEGKYVLSEMIRDDSTLVQEVENKYGASTAAFERTTEIDINNLDKNIGVNLTEDQNAEQLLILKEFFNIAKAANGLFIITEATNYDTAKFSNADDFRRKQMKTLNQYKFAEDSFRISSAKDLLDKTHLRALVDALIKANRGLGAILRFNMPSYRAVINKVIDTYAINDYISKDKFSRIANKLSASLLDYIIQTNVEFDAAKLVYGEDSVITKFQEAVVSHPDMKILQDLEVIPGKTIVAPATIALKVSPETAADKNRYTEGFRELRDNAETNDLYNGLVKLAILQGTYKTSVSFREVVPIEDISTEITKAVNAPGVEERLRDYYKNARFQRTNFNDPVVTPRVNPPMIDLPEANVPTQWGDEIEAYSFTSAISFNRKGAESARDLIGLHLKSKGAAYDFVTMSRAIPTKSGDMVDFETGYTIQGVDYAAEMQKDESIYNKIYGYQKVKYTDGTPVKMKMDKDSPEQYVYKLVNLYGDGRFLTQYQNTLQKSELENGTVKVDKEYSDDSIIEALRRQSKLVGYGEYVAPVVQPVVETPTVEAEPVVEQRPANADIIEKLEMAKNKLEAFELSPDGIFYNYFKSGARIKPGSFDKLVDRNKRSASTNGAYTSTKGAYSYDSLARQAFEASNMEVDDTYAVEALEEFLSNYPDTWKTPYDNIINEIKDLENQLNPTKKSTEKVVSSQLSLFDENQPEGLPAINRSPKTC